MRSAAFHQSQHRGYTLVEFVVCVGIVALLLAIIIPGAARARDQARIVQCTANIASITKAILGSAAERHGRMPLARTTPAPARFWFDKDQAGPGLVDEARLPLKKPAGGVLACPADDGSRSYAMNVWASSELDQQILINGGGVLWGKRVSGDAYSIVVVESFSHTGTKATGYLAQPIVGVEGSTAGRRFGGSGGVPPFYAGRFGAINCELDFSRHRKPGSDLPRTHPIGRLNIGYADGHVALKSSSDLVNEQGQSTGDSVWYPGEKR